jgi:peptidoglycan/LPS O-acetylase OafA/YrhL
VLFVNIWCSGSTGVSEALSVSSILTIFEYSKLLIKIEFVQSLFIYMQHYSFLDVLRGIAILGVLLVHLPMLGGLQTPHRFEIGKIGVPMFFMLSCYTLCLSQSQRAESSWKSFFIRRVFRIYPLFFLVVTYLLLLQIGEHIYMRGKFDSYTLMTYITKYTFTYGFFPQYITNLFLGEWSLFNEIIFYILFPLLYGICSKNPRNALIAFALAWCIHYGWVTVWEGYKHSGIQITGPIYDYTYYAPLYHIVDFMA